MFDALHIFLLMRFPVDGSFGVFSPASQIEPVLEAAGEERGVRDPSRSTSVCCSLQ